MIKQELTTDRKVKIFRSVQFMHIMAEMIRMEFRMYMDVNFRNPAVNNHASRISQSAQAIQQHLSFLVKAKDTEYREEYTAELHRVFNFFIGLDIEQIREFMDGAEAQAREVQQLTSHQ